MLGDKKIPNTQKNPSICPKYFEYPILPQLHFCGHCAGKCCSAASDPRGIPTPCLGSLHGACQPQVHTCSGILQRLGLIPGISIHTPLASPGFASNKTAFPDPCSTPKHPERAAALKLGVDRLSRHLQSSQNSYRDSTPQEFLWLPSLVLLHQDGCEHWFHLSMCCFQRQQISRDLTYSAWQVCSVLPPCP